MLSPRGPISVLLLGLLRSSVFDVFFSKTLVARPLSFDDPTLATNDYRCIIPVPQRQASYTNRCRRCEHTIFRTTPISNRRRGGARGVCPPPPPASARVLRRAASVVFVLRTRGPSSSYSELETDHYALAPPTPLYGPANVFWTRARAQQPPVAARFT